MRTTVKNILRKIGLYFLIIVISLFGILFVMQSYGINIITANMYEDKGYHEMNSSQLEKINDKLKKYFLYLPKQIFTINDAGGYFGAGGYHPLTDIITMYLPKDRADNIEYRLIGNTVFHETIHLNISKRSFPKKLEYRDKLIELRKLIHHFINTDDDSNKSNDFRNEIRLVALLVDDYHIERLPDNSSKLIENAGTNSIYVYSGSDGKFFNQYLSGGFNIDGIMDYYINPLGSLDEYLTYMYESSYYNANTNEFSFPDNIDTDNQDMKQIFNIYKYFEKEIFINKK